MSALFGLSALVAYAPARQDPVREVARPGDQFVTVSGTRLRYRRVGAEQAADQPRGAVLVHGFGCSTEVWGPVMDLLEDVQAPVYAFDMPGFGLSDKPLDYEYSINAQAEKTRGFMTAMGLESAVLVGHSFGGVVAVMAAATDPRVDEFVVLAPGVFGKGRPKVLSYLFPPFDRLSIRMFTLRSFRARLVTKGMADPSLLSDDMLTAFMYDVSTEGSLDAMTYMVGLPSVTSHVPGYLPRIKAHTTIFWGDNDRSHPVEHGERLQRALPSSELHVLQSGHYLQLEHPARVASAIRDALLK